MSGIRMHNGGISPEGMKYLPAVLSQQRLYSANEEWELNEIELNETI